MDDTRNRPSGRSGRLRGPTALAVVGLFMMSGCASWQTCLDSPYVPTSTWWIGMTDHPIAVAVSLGLGPAAHGICAAVVQTKTAIERSQKPPTQPGPVDEPVDEPVPNDEESAR